MIFSIFLLFCSAVCGTVFTILNSRCAKDGANFNIVQGQNAGAMFLFSLLMAFFLHQYPDSLKNALIVIAVHSLAGIFSFISLVFMATAMKTGHNGITAAIVNASLIFPCVTGVLFMGEVVNAGVIAAMTLILTGIAVIGFEKPSSPTEKISKRSWFISVSMALLCAGISGCLNIVLSYFPEIQAQPIFRTAGNCLGGFCCYLLSINMIPRLGMRRRTFRREAVYILIAFLSCTISCYVFTYNAYDRLAALKRAGIALPLIVGFSTVIFMMYSIFFNREKTSISDWIGFGCIMGGLVLIVSC